MTAARPTAAAAPRFAGLEATLDGLVARLAAEPGTRESRALLIEARRLRCLVGNWRAVPPSAAALGEMSEHVVDLERAAEVRLAPARPAPADEPELAVPSASAVESAPAARPVAAAEPALSDRSALAPEPARAALPAAIDPARAGAVSMASARERTRVVRVALAERAEQLDPRLVLLREPRSARADAYRGLRRRLGSGPGARIVAITSAGSGEGRTTCAVNLALALREGAAGPVLLLEANVRAPGLAALFGFTPPECFARAMAVRREPPSRPWTVAEPAPGLHVLAFDPAAERAPALDPTAFGRALEQLTAAGYSQVVVDGPPVLGNVEAQVVADAADGIVLASRLLVTTKKALQRALDHLGTRPVLGLVVHS